MPLALPTPSAIALIDVQHQQVDIAPFTEGGLVKGVQTITFQATETGDRLRFLGGLLEIASVRLDDQAVPDWRVEDGAIEIGLGRRVEAGSDHVLHLEYKTASARGIKRVDGLAYSTYFACDWMLCDQADFGDRFTFDLSIRTPRGMKTLGPGTEIGTTPLDGDMELHRWRSDEPYPAYAHGFVAGRLETHDVAGGCVTRLDVMTTASKARVAAIFGSTCAMVEYFQQRAGVPYPTARYSQLYLPDAGEAQEAISHSTLGGGAVEAMLSDPTEDWAVAHELAHQWWGNRVTAINLSEFWLNEGIVTFMTASWKQHRWGDAAYEREIELARGRWMRCRDEWRDVPLTFAGEYPSLSMRRCFHYSKAAVFMHELRQRMGEDSFWRGLRDYTVSNLGRSITSKDFESAMQGETSTDLRPLFLNWVDAKP